MDKKESAVKPEKPTKPTKPGKPEQPHDGSKAVPYRIALSGRNVFNIVKGGDIDGTRYPDAHRISALVYDTDGNILTGASVVWSVVSPTHPVRITQSGSSSQNAALYGTNIQSGFNLTVTAKVSGYSIATNRIIAVNVV